MRSLQCWGICKRCKQLYLVGNQLTGEIPEELGELPDLQAVFLSGNSFTGCIPSAWRTIGVNDFVWLGLEFCTGPG